MATFPKARPAIEKFIAENATAANATGIPGEDNMRVLAFLEEESRAIEGPPVSWEHRSPWSLHSCWFRDSIAIDLIRLNRWHYLETRNPIFALRARALGRFLSDIYRSEYLSWVEDYLDEITNSLIASVNHPSKAKRPGVTIAKALGFPVRKNYDPFRRARAIMEADAIYAIVRQLANNGTQLTGDGGAFAEVAQALKIAQSKVRAAYYERRRLLEKDLAKLANDVLVR